MLLLEKAVERVIMRQRLDDARHRQEQRLTKGVGADTGVNTSTPGGYYALPGADGKGEKKGKGKGKGGKKGRGGGKGGEGVGKGKDLKK